MANDEWFKREKRNKEIVIRLRHEHLKKAVFVLMILALVGIIVAQHYELIPTVSKINKTEKNHTEKASEVVGPIENKTTEVKATEQNKTNAINETKAANTTNTSKTTSTEEKTWPITGEITFTIDKVNYTLKSGDFAVINSVTYTIINQKKDFTPVIKGYFYDDSDDPDYVEETIELEELEAGKSLIKTSSIHISYDEINKTKTLKLVLEDDEENTLKIAKKEGKFN